MAMMEETRAIVEEGETYEGSVYPTRRREIDRPVRVGPRGRVEGGIYGSSISLEQEAVVSGPLMASETIEIDGASVLGDAGTPGVVEATDAIAGNSLTGTKVTVENSVVWGNVIGEDVRVRNSFVLGLLVGRDHLAVESSSCYTLKATGETRLSDVTVSLPQAQVGSPLELETPVEVGTLAEAEAVGEGDAALTEEDLVIQEDDRYLSLVPRVLNLDEVENQLRTNEARLQSLVEAAEKTPPDEWIDRLQGADIPRPSEPAHLQDPAVEALTA